MMCQSNPVRNPIPRVGLIVALLAGIVAALLPASAAGLRRAERTPEVVAEPVLPAPAPVPEAPPTAQPAPAPPPPSVATAPSPAPHPGSMITTVRRLPQEPDPEQALQWPAPGAVQQVRPLPSPVVPAVEPVLGAPAVVAPAEGALLSTPPPGALVLTPDDAARVALDNSTDLVISAASIEEAQAEVLRAFGLDDVQVSLSASTSLRRARTGVRLDDEGDAVTTGGGTNTSWSAGVSVSKTLYTGGRIERTQQAATLSVEAARISEAVVRRALRLTAHEAAYEVLRAEQLSHVAAQQAVAVSAHLELSRQLLEAGSVARFEVVQAETELARAQGEVISARTVLEQALSQLKRLLTLPQQDSVAVIPGPERDLPAGTLEDLIPLALARRPEVREAALAVQAAELTVRLARDTRNVSLSVDGSVSESDGGSGPDWQVGLTLRKPLLDGQAERSEVRRAQARLEATRARRVQAEEDVAREVARYHIALREAHERLRVAGQGVIEARTRADIAQVRYETGYALGVEVLDAATALAQAEAELVNSQYNLQVAVTQLRSALGELDDAWLSPG